MKTIFSSTLIAVLISLLPSVVVSQFDDLYFRPGKDVLPAFAERNNSGARSNVAASAGNYDEYDEIVYGNEYYDDYDYSYTNRIRRFHSPARVINYYTFDGWYDDFYYDPFFPGNNVNVFIGSPFIRPWGWNTWNVGWGWNSWGWNSWGPGWGWNAWHRPWGWNSWNTWNVGWGWNSWGWNSWGPGWGWNSCPSVWYVNNNFFGNNWNGWNNWNNGNQNRVVNSSRRGGSTSSSTRGISASPRREVSGGVPGQVDRLPDSPSPDNSAVNSAASRGGADRSRIYRGDIKNPDADVVRDNTTNVTRSSIYRRPETQRAEPGRSVDRSDSGTNSPDINRNSSRRSTQGVDSNRSNSDSPRPNINSSPSRPAQDNSRPAPSRSGGGFDSGSSSPRSSGGGSMNSGSSRSSSGGSMNSGGGSSRSSSGGGSRRGG